MKGWLEVRLVDSMVRSGKRISLSDICNVSKWLTFNVSKIQTTCEHGGCIVEGYWCT
jgi:hypothetical protein